MSSRFAQRLRSAADYRRQSGRLPSPIHNVARWLAAPSPVPQAALCMRSALGNLPQRYYRSVGASRIKRRTSSAHPAALLTTPGYTGMRCRSFAGCRCRAENRPTPEIPDRWPRRPGTPAAAGPDPCCFMFAAALPGPAWSGHPPCHNSAKRVGNRCRTPDPMMMLTVPSTSLVD